MNIFEFKFNEDDELKYGTFAMSIVQKPAMQSGYVALSEEKVLLKVQDDKKKILTGVALIPNKLITRVDKKTKEPYQAFFSAETVEKTSQRFLQDFNQSNVTVEHMLSVDDVTVVESWIKTDDKLDKSVALGIEAPVGSWLMTLKVEDDELWDGLIETGLLTGFSIEGNYDRTPVETEMFKEINENAKYMDKNDKTILKTIRELFQGNVELAEDKVAQVSKWYDDVESYDVKEGVQIMRKPYEEGGESTPLGSGDYETEGGVRFLTDNEGYIRYIFGDAPEVVEEETEEVEETVEEVVEASEVVAETVETVAPVETPEAVVETPETPVAETVADVIEEIKDEVEPQLIPHTDAEKVVRKPKVKYDAKLTVQERIKQGLGTL